MTPKRHAIAKEIIKLLYPGPPFGTPFSLVEISGIEPLTS